MISRLSIFSVLLVALLAGTGCKAINAVTGTARAATDTKNAWVLNDPAPMSVVVRRADAAEKTSGEVDRLLTKTPALPTPEGATWTEDAAPTVERANKEIEEVAAHKLYQDSMARVVEAEVWARTLPAVGAGAAVSVDAGVPAPAAPSSPKGKPAKPGKKASSSDAKTATAPKTVKDASKAGGPSLLGGIDPSLDAAYAKVLEREKKVAALRVDLAAKEAAVDEKGITSAEKASRKEGVSAVEKQISQEEAEIPRLRSELVDAVRLAAGKAPSETRARLGAALVALRVAVADAESANGAAGLKYPLASTTLPDSTKAMAYVYLDDVIEERTGKRPRVDQGVSPTVSLDGSKVVVTVNGLEASDFAKLNAADVGREVTTRTQKWLTHALTLLGSIAATREILAFEHAVVDAAIGGFEGAGWTAPPAPKIPLHDPKKTVKAKR